MFPNPTSGALTLTFPGELEQGAVRVLDLAGRVVMDMAIAASRTASVELEIGQLQAGLYVVELVSGAARWTGYVVRD
jgi:hypothetical protein